MKKFSLIIFLSFVFLIGVNAYSTADQSFSVLNIQSHLRSWNSGAAKEILRCYFPLISEKESMCCGNAYHPKVYPEFSPRIFIALPLFFHRLL